MQFAEEYFTDYAADSLHNPTVKSCLLRIPGSLNSKRIENDNDGQISVIQKWDGKRPPILSRGKNTATQFTSHPFTVAASGLPVAAVFGFVPGLITGLKKG